MNADSLETIIRRYVSLPSVQSGTGWYPVLCKVCSDHGKKGPRGGFKFDGSSVAYHCFNCGPPGATFDPDKHRKMPDKMQQVLDAFGVPSDEWKRVIFDTLSREPSSGEKEQQAKSIVPDVIEPPSTFYYLKDAGTSDKWAQIATFYLESRGIDPSDYPFMLAHPTDFHPWKKWIKRVIIPIYKDGNLVFYQGRDLTGKALKKYESPSVSREKVIFGFDQLFAHTEAPLFVAEGWFDGFVVNGAALLGNKISDPQIQWFNRSRRRKVYIPDRFGNGKQVAERVLNLGWEISTPDIGDCKDLNEAYVRYGKLYLMSSIVENISSGFAAQARLGVYCR